MKILSKQMSWSHFSDQLGNLLVSKQKNTRPSLVESTKRNSFFTFQRPRKSFERPPSLEHAYLNLDLNWLRQISDEARLKGNSYQGFIASHLKHGPIDDGSKFAISRSVAIEKMLALLSETIQEMKAIELKRISQSKG